MILKSKSLFYMLLLGYTSLYAEWGSISLKEHVDRSSLIVVAEFDKEIERKEREMGIYQLVSFETSNTIKGDISGSFLVKGQALEMCMPQMLFPNSPKTTYLLFLKQEDNSSTYNLVHGERSALVIENRSVGWISDKDKIDAGETVTTALEKVKEQIVQFAKESSNKKEEKPVEVWNIYRGVIK